MLRGLTGEDFSARDLAEDCNDSIDEARVRAETLMRAAQARRYPDDGPASLDADIRIVHGADLIADSSDGEDAMCDHFEAWVRERYPIRLASV
jgi:hypothetical protein